jgi:hypothetical protein
VEAVVVDVTAGIGLAVAVVYEPGLAARCSLAVAVVMRPVPP